MFHRAFLNDRPLVREDEVVEEVPALRVVPERYSLRLQYEGILVTRPSMGPSS